MNARLVKAHADDLVLRWGDQCAAEQVLGSRLGVANPELRFPLISQLALSEQRGSASAADRHGSTAVDRDQSSRCGMPRG